MKGTAPFEETLFIAFYQQKLCKNGIFEQLPLGTNETYWLRLSQSICFKPLNESSNDQHPVHSILSAKSQQIWNGYGNCSKY